MRKYYTLVLITVTVVSVVCLVFYKTQYDKLYNVLQVLEFFGSKDNGAKGPLWENAFLSGVATFRPPSFQRINDNAFVFSAFCFSTPGVKDGGHCGTVMAIAVVRAPLDAGKLSCKLWYEGSYSGLAGSFSSAETTVESAAASEGFKSYQLFCQNKFASKVPFSVEFILESKEHASVHVFQPSSGLATTPSPKTVGVCVAPQPGVEDTTFSALESILLNRHFGIKHFLLYDRGLTSKFFAQLDRAKMNTDLNIHVVPWNPPTALTADHTQWIVETDCFHRTRHTIETQLVLGVSQVVVPRRESSVQRVLDDYRGKGLFTVPVLKFCSELPSDPEAATNTYSMRSLEQTRHDLRAREEKTVIRKGAEDMNSGVILDGGAEMSINDYGACGTFDFEDEKIAKDAFMASMASELQEKYGVYFPMKSV